MHILVPDNLDQIGLDMLAQTPGVTFEASKKMSREDLLKKAPEADGLIIRSASKVDAEMLAALSKVKAVTRAGVGVDNVDLVAATERGVVVMNAPDGNTIATAEQTLALMLALARHIPQAYASLKGGKWDRNSFLGTELRGKTLGIIGLGRVGQAVAKRAAAFEMSLVAYDPFVNQAAAQALGVQMLDLDALYAQSDYITLHAVATPQTRNMINAANIAKMKDGVRIINVARGTLVEEADLAAAIQSGKVTGAALDVFADEPPLENNPLIGLESVIHTPHLGASTLEAQNEVAVQAVNNLLNALLKGQYNNVVNPDVLARIAK